MPQGPVRRVYVPSDVEGLRRLHRTGRLGSGLEGYAATDALRSQLGDLGDEELEYALTTAAGEAVPADPAGAAPYRRIVLVVDVDERDVCEDPQAPGLVTMTAAVRSRQVAAVLADPPPEGALGGATSDQLGWFATQEIADLLA